MAGIFVRGLTGNKVNVFVDGVRYSTGAQRGGVSTFLDLDRSGAARFRGSAARPEQRRVRQRRARRQPAVPLPRAVGRPAERPAVGRSRLGGRQLGGPERRIEPHRCRMPGPRIGALFGLAGRRIGDLRPGGGVDSHAAVTRFLGVTLDRADAGAPARHRLRPVRRTDVAELAGRRERSCSSRRTADGRQDGGKRYDQLLGGDGNLIADLRDLTLDLFYVRYERVGAGLVRSRSASPVR